MEFFQSKISSSSTTIADVEMRVFSGLPFWEINEELLMGLVEENAHLVTENMDGSFVSQLGYKNVLASKVVERIAVEKRYKLTLNQELETIKDKFNQLEKVMMRFDLSENPERAATFLGEYS